MRTLGFDPALRHGAVVLGYWKQIDGNIYFASVDEIFHWTKKDAIAIGQRAAPKEIYRLTASILASMQPYKGVAVGIDYSKYIGHFKSRKIQVVTQSFFAGYFTARAQTQGHPVVFIDPSLIRKMIGGKTKEDVWESFCNMSECHHDWPAGELRDDLRDALILSYIVARGAGECYLTYPDSHS